MASEQWVTQYEWLAQGGIFNEENLLCVVLECHYHQRGLMGNLPYEKCVQRCSRTAHRPNDLVSPESMKQASAPESNKMACQSKVSEAERETVRGREEVSLQKVRLTSIFSSAGEPGLLLYSTQVGVQVGRSTGIDALENAAPLTPLSIRLFPISWARLAGSQAYVQVTRERGQALGRSGEIRYSLILWDSPQKCID